MKPSHSLHLKRWLCRKALSISSSMSLGASSTSGTSRMRD